MANFLQKFFSRKPKAEALSIPLVPNPSGLIIAARVDKIEKHPNADRLRVVEVNDGMQVISPIVCGAFNFEAGDVIALALPGANIAQNIHSAEHESFTLGKAKIRGIESQGMICAAFELGLTNKPGDGIMVLPKSVAPGTILA